MIEYFNIDILIVGQMQIVKEMVDSFVVVNFNVYVWWYVKCSYGLIDDSGNCMKCGCVMV